MRPPEPPIVTLWRNTPPGIPRCCHTCTFYSPEGFCSEFEAVPPEDHAATLDACESWESEDGIPI